MAKRKRLTPAQPDYLETSPAAEAGPAPFGAARPPISQVAGEAATASALDEMSRQWREARESGRLVQEIALERIEAGHLIRDRMAVDEEEMQALAESLRTRGQQTPIEIVPLDDDRFGLISGWRRLTALRRLYEETGEERYGRALAILRRPESAAEAYLAMVEENEIRVGLSYYERARIAARAVEQGVFSNEKSAVESLFASASPPKRSKIGSFLLIYHTLDSALNFGPAITERMGLRLSKVLKEKPEVAERIRAALGQGAKNAKAETVALEAVLEQEAANVQAEVAAQPVPLPAQKPVPRERKARPVARVNGINVAAQEGDGRRMLTLSGSGVTAELVDALVDWLKSRT